MDNDSEPQETVLNPEKIVFQYRKWLLSEPFDVDEPVFNAISATLADCKGAYAKEAAILKNKDLVSGSALARLSPLAVWASSLSDDNQFYKAVIAEVELTNGNKIVQDACFVYCYVIKAILTH